MRPTLFTTMSGKRGGDCRLHELGGPVGVETHPDGCHDDDDRSHEVIEASVAFMHEHRA
jgi:hypothetical protein